MSAVLVAARLAKMVEAEGNKGRGRRRAEFPANLQGIPLGASPGPLGLVQMPPVVEVQTEGQLGQRVTTSRGLALPLGKARLDARLEAGAVAVAAVDDASLGVHQDGLEQPVLPDVGDQLLKCLALQQWKEVGDGVKFQFLGHGFPENTS